MRAAAQRGLERKVHSGTRHPLKFSEKNLGRGYRSGFGAQRRQTACNQIGIHEVRNTRISEEKFSRECRFARPVWASDHDTPGFATN